MSAGTKHKEKAFSQKLKSTFRCGQITEKPSRTKSPISWLAGPAVQDAQRSIDQTKISLTLRFGHSRRQIVFRF